VTVSNRGKVKIIFNKPMNFPDYLPDLINSRQRKSEINGERRLSSVHNSDSIIEVKIEKSGDQKFENVEFTWNATIPTDNIIEVQMYFDKPLEISMTDVGIFDAVNVKLLEERFFRDPETG
jgi:hypothetical protein